MPQAKSSSSVEAYEGLGAKISQIQRYYDESLQHADVRALAEAICSNPQGSLDIVGFFDKLKSLTRYVPDPTKAELIKAPWVMVEQIHNEGKAAGDCDDLASLAYTLLHSVGVPAMLYVGWYRGSTNPSHILLGIPQKKGGYAAFDMVANRYGQTNAGITRAEAYA